MSNNFNEVTLHETALGKYWIPEYPPGDFIGNCMAVGQIFDQHVYNMALPYVHESAVVLDLGSNLGQMAMEFAKLAPQGQVYAFEAHPFLYAVMCKNFDENQFTNITPMFGAVWDSADLELFYPDPDYETFGCRGSWGINPETPVTEFGVTVNSLTIDSLNLEQVDFMKIDIQGADLRALKGARKTIERCKPAIVFEFELAFAGSLFKEDLQDYLNFVDEIGYKIINEKEHNYLIVPK
jgi:FkbM family methyltransferase